MHDGSQGNARAHAGASEHALVSVNGNHTPSEQRKHCQYAPTRQFLLAVDRVAFERQFVLIAADNSSPARVDSLDTARAAVATGLVSTAGGRLADGLLGCDIDADDPIVGDACAESLIAWCDKHGLPYLLRESGRPGGRHVIAVATNAQVPVREWARLCQKVSRRYRVVVQDRTGQVMRLTTAPHRIGLPAPVIACTLTPAAVVDAIRIHRRTFAHATHRPSASRIGRANIVAAGTDSSRSAREFGDVCAMVRHGWTPQRIWAEIAGQDGKAAQKGERWARRYMLMKAVTVVAAEEGADEADAWGRASRACPEIRAKGRDWWRYWWRRALKEANRDRPRRRRLPGDRTGENSALSQELATELDAVRRGLRAAADTVLVAIDPRRRHSVHAALHALAYALVTRDGSMSDRTLAEWARIDTHTVRAVRRTAVDTGLLVITRSYGGGTKDCTAYGLGPAAQHAVAAARRISSPTTCTTPVPLGSACPHRLRLRHTADRKRWSLRCDVLAVLAPGERLATSRHPAACLLRSLWYQRNWWRSLTPEQQRARVQQRQALLRKLDAADRSAWFGWLGRRELVCNAVDRIQERPAAATHGDIVSVLTTPLTIHRGMADPRWRDGGLRPERTSWPRDAGRGAPRSAVGEGSKGEGVAGITASKVASSAARQASGCDFVADSFRAFELAR
ncbi:hypothetical protein [Nocardia sp. IFM 10818]